MNLVIDNREVSLIERIQLKIENFPNLQCEVRALDVGDMEVYYKDELLYVWERKSFDDLISSINDGRYKEQSYRLTNIYGPRKIVYLLEGIVSQLNPQSKKIVLSTIAALSFRKDYHVLRSVHINDSADTFLATCDKIRKDIENEEKYNNNIPEGTDYSGFVKKKKKENITPDNIGEIILCQIPDINSNTAKAILNHAQGSLTNLLHIIKTSPDELYNIQIGDQKLRKISKKVVERLKEFLSK